MRCIRLLALACGLTGCIEKQPPQAVNAPEAIPTDRDAHMITPSDPFKDVIDEVPLVDPPTTLSNDAIQIGREMTLVGRCESIGAKIGLLVVTNVDAQEEVISINGPWPDSVRRYSELHPDSAMGAEVRGVVAEIRGKVYLRSPRVLKMWKEPIRDSE